MASRPELSTVVSEVLVKSGDSDVAHSIATNAGASLSERAFTNLSNRAQ